MEFVKKYKMPKKSILSFPARRKLKFGILLTGIITLLLSAAVAFDAVAKWGAKYEIVYQTPLKVIVESPIVIRERQIEPNKVYVVEHVTYEVKPAFYASLSEVEKQICDEFGLHCREAIAVARAESGLRESVFNINTNNTIDVGLFQINSIHYSKTGCSLKEVSTAIGNIKCAKQIFDASGWNAWVAYNSGAYIKFLK